ncbi:MAG: UvrD-helicase domain-containing protein, partial [Opitutales bacterium]|nr:UvrD-helicase domain-containing protein [Opitutales bacterium]
MSIAFDIGSTPLRNGLNLLEASAGSGKTYTIEGLFLRLIVERNVPLREILVCTFTKAATRELRARIRERLQKGRVELEAGSASDAALCAAIQAAGLDQRTALLRMAMALESFDQAQIFTIHGFCSRVLSEHAFESGCGFEMDLSGDTASLAGAIALDFRRKLNAEAPELLLFVENRGWELVKSCVDAMKARGADRDIQLRPEYAAAWHGPEQAAREMRELLQGIVAQWESDGEEILAFMQDQKRAKIALRNMADAVDFAMRELARGRLSSMTLGAVETLTEANIEEGRIQRCKEPIPQTALFGMASRFGGLLAEARLGLVHTFMKEVDEAADRQREISGKLGFDDLLYQTSRALSAGGVLAGVLRSRYRVALVDEFQDTDRLQWGIFSKVFCTPSHSLYIIGDPKQAIYRFRGADVHAYMEAASRADASLTLDTNWRSDEALVRAVNTLFSATEKPFGEDGIDFVPAKASGRIDEARAFSCGSVPPEPMRFVLPRPELERAGDSWALALLCEDILALLTGEARIGTRPVQGSDIAVIVPTHSDAAGVCAALAKLGVQAVEDSTQSVFDSAEARSVRDLLCAMLEAGNDGLRRWVMAGMLFGLDAAELARMDEDEKLWRRWDDAFHAFLRDWAESGIAAAFRAFELSTGLRPRVMGQPGGERSLTNVLHLVELLNDAEHRERLAPPALLQWLDRMRNDSAARPQDGHQTRLESDVRAVTVITRHKSKGLEFPIVFLPFENDVAALKKDQLIQSREEDGPALWLLPASGLDDDLRSQALREELNEDMRLLYVSLTRARNRCVVYVQRDTIEKSARQMALPVMLGASDWEGFVSAIERCKEAARDAFAIEYRDYPLALVPLENAAHGEELSCRHMRRRLDTRPMITSFSALHGDSARVATLPVEELPDREDSPIAVADTDVELSGVAAFPKGTAAGSFFHACFEHVDFAAPEGWRAEVEKQLVLAGLDASQWLETALACMGEVLHTPLEKGGFALAGM